MGLFSLGEIMSKKRELIWNKTGGKCFYCGCELPKKGWHADHFHPIVREIVPVKNISGITTGYTTGKECQYPELDTVENMVPSCAPCNNFKHSYSIDGYRKIIAEQFKNTLKNSTGLRQLERLGLVDLSEKPVEFWYEKEGIEPPCELKMIGISDEAKDLEWIRDNSEPCYFYHDFGRFICSLRRIDSYWLAIAIGSGWHEFGRKEFPNGRHVMHQAAEWAIRLSGDNNGTNK